MSREETARRRWEVFRFSSWLGIVGFGGPQAHIALMQQEAQAKRGWLSEAQFSDALAVCNILPGPASTQLITYLGWWRGGGLVGGLLAAVGFIWPTFVLMVGLSWLYFSFGALPHVNAFFYGLKPVVVAIVGATTWRLARPSRRDWRFWLLVSLSAVLIGGRFLNDFLVFVGAALLGLLLYPEWRNPLPPPSNPSPVPDSKPTTPRLLLGLLLAQASESGGFWAHSTDLTRLGQLAWFFLRTGAVIFGGGLVIVPLIQNEVVAGYGWLTQAQFVDGVALGQATPGPVLITAAFVGYAAAGLVGAITATVAIFLPGLTMILLVAPFLTTIRQFAPARAALSGVNGAVVGSLLAGAYLVGQSAFLFPARPDGWLRLDSRLLDPYTVAIALIALCLIVHYKVNTIYLFLAVGGTALLLNWWGIHLPGAA